MKETLIHLLAQVDPAEVNIPKAGANDINVQVILQLVFMFAGAICVLVITIAGLSYVLSTGDPQKAAKAKDSILYAVIGLSISILAYAIVTFVLKELFQ